MKPLSRATGRAILLLTPLLCGSTFAAVVAPSSPLSVSVQDDEEKEEKVPDKRKEVKNLLADLKSQIRKRGLKDRDAISTIEALMGEFKKSGSEDRKSIVKGLADVYKQKRRYSDEKGYDNDLYLATAAAMGFMGPECVKPVVKLIGNNAHRANLVLQARLVQSLGKTKAEEAVKPLLDLLGHKDPEIEQAAAQALGNFGGLEEKQRKVVFEEVLKALMSAYGNKEADPSNETARRRYDAVSASMGTSLQALSGHEEGTPPKWQTWWNKNRRTNWSKLNG